MSVAVVCRPQPSGFAPVYNLTVSGVPEYFANGLLVHNCDATRYLLMGRPPLSPVPYEEQDVPKNKQAGHANNERLLKRLARMAAMEEEAATGAFTVDDVPDDETMAMDQGSDAEEAIRDVWQ